jgi:two-component system, NtrC family, response regulator AtoC
MTRILVVDDDPAVVAVVTELLSTIGYEVTAASGVRSAIALLSRVKPDVVITDSVMEDGEGKELILYLTRYRPRPAIISMSGNPTEMLFLRASRVLGVKAVLRKPFTRSDLEEALKTALAGRHDKIEEEVVR